MTSGPQDPTGDPVAEPTDPTDTNAAESSDMSSNDTPDPTQELRDPTADPMPFRVEPSTPVPDDAVAEATHLPHLPPPGAEQAVPTQPVQQAPPVLAPAPRPALVTVHKGPRPATIMLGLLSVLMAAYVLVANLTDAHLSVRMLGPTMIGAFGGMLLLVGLAGVVAGRLRR